MASIRQQFITQIRTELRAMVSYALGTGIVVPAWAVAALEHRKAGEGGEVPGEEGAGGEKTTLLSELARAHAELSKLIAPGTPELMLLIYKEADAVRLRRTLGQIRIVR